MVCVPAGERAWMRQSSQARQSSRMGAPVTAVPQRPSAKRSPSLSQAKRSDSAAWPSPRMLTANTVPSRSSISNAVWRLSITVTISGGSAETEANAETVNPWTSSPCRMVTMVTPAGKWRMAFRKSLDEIKSGLSCRGRALQRERPADCPITALLVRTLLTLVPAGMSAGASPRAARARTEVEELLNEDRSAGREPGRATRPGRRGQADRCLLCRSAGPRRARAAGLLRHFGPSRLRLRQGVQRVAHPCHRPVDLRLAPAGKDRWAVVYGHRHPRAVAAGLRDRARGAGGERGRGDDRGGWPVYPDAGRLPRHPHLQPRPHRRACRRHRGHPLAQPAGGWWLQVQPASRRPGGGGDHLLDPGAGPRGAPRRACRRAASAPRQGGGHAVDPPA